MNLKIGNVLIGRLGTRYVVKCVHHDGVTVESEYRHGLHISSGTTFIHSSNLKNFKRERDHDYNQ